MLIFFKKNNFTGYYNEFASACRVRNNGKNLLGAGLGLMAGGIVCVVLGFTVTDYNNYSYGYGYTYREKSYPILWMSFVGYAFIGVGEVLTIVSIPISAGAGARKKAIKNDFAREHFGTGSYTYQPMLKFGCTVNGLGISLKF